MHGFDLHQTLDDMEVIPPIEPKVVLEHRAPKISPPILHTRCAESKVGRAVRCALELFQLARLFGMDFGFPRAYERGVEFGLVESSFGLTGVGLVFPSVCLSTVDKVRFLPVVIAMSWGLLPSRVWFRPIDR